MVIEVKSNIFVCFRFPQCWMGNTTSWAGGLPVFTVNSIIVLFLDTTQNDGKSNANFKPVVGDCKAIRLFQAGYVSKIRFVRVGDKVFFRAQSQPEMKSSADYQIAFVVKSAPPAVIDDTACVEKFLQSSCTYPAGRGPLATCKHIAAVLNGLEHFCRLGFTKRTCHLHGEIATMEQAAK